MQQELETLKKWIDNSDNIVFFGGAGVARPLTDHARPGTALAVPGLFRGRLRGKGLTFEL